MKEQFTPGEWSIKKKRTGVEWACIIDGKGNEICDMVDSYPINERERFSRPLRDANAKLIAKSPDMYAIIKGLISEMDGEGGIKQNSEHIINARYLLEEIVK